MKNQKVKSVYLSNEAIEIVQKEAEVKKWSFSKALNEIVLTKNENK